MSECKCGYKSYVHMAPPHACEPTPPGAEAGVERLSSPNVVALAKALHEERIRAESAEARVSELEERAWARRWKAAAKSKRSAYAVGRAIRMIRDLRAQLSALREAVGPLEKAVEYLLMKSGCTCHNGGPACPEYQALAAFRTALAGKENGGG
jgi:hypothetical protein